MLAPLSEVPGCKRIAGVVSGNSAGRGWACRWVAVEKRLLMLGWVLVVDVGLGGWGLGSKSSVEEGSRDMAATRLRLVEVVSMESVGVRGYISLPVFR